MKTSTNVFEKFSKTNQIHNRKRKIPKIFCEKVTKFVQKSLPWWCSETSSLNGKSVVWERKDDI
jgi:hypothetical protein